MRKVWQTLLVVLVLAATTALPASAYTFTYYGWVWNGYGWRLTQVKPVTQPTVPSVPQQAKPTATADGGTGNTGTGATAAADTRNLTADESYILQQVNAERAKAGLNPLSIDYRLVATARAKSKDMIDHGYFDHQSPTYGSPFDQMRDAGITYSYAGENIAGNSSAAGAMQAWMNSPGHRANILNPNFTKIGIGVVDGGPYGKMLTQQFIG